MAQTLRPVPFDLSDQAREQSTAALQGWLPRLITVALRLEQAHWNLRGNHVSAVEKHHWLLDSQNGA